MTISPKQAFDALKVLRPNVDAISLLPGNLHQIKVHCPNEYPYNLAVAPIDWGSTGIYPIPEPTWRDAKPSDVAYPFKKARFRDALREEWKTGTLTGYSTRNGGSTKCWQDMEGFNYWQCQVAE